MASIGGPEGGGGVAGVIDDPTQGTQGFDMGAAVTAASTSKPEAAILEQEQALVRKYSKKYEAARKFDETFREQIAVDRRYAAGTSDLSWAVTTNLIGAFIDILVALLYARNPDVSVRKSPQVDEDDTAQNEMFARTLEIVVSHLWAKGKLKKGARKAVRSVLSNSEGWLKCTIVSEKKPQPEVEAALNDAQETVAKLKAQQKIIDDQESREPDTAETELQEKQDLIDELEGKLELAVNKMFVIDYVPTENVQVSTDVTCISDYLEADWIGNEIYVLKADALASCPDLEADDLKEAKLFYQRPPQGLATRSLDNPLPQIQQTAESALAFTTNSSDANSDPFVRLIEIWDRTDKKIRTMIDGVKKWAKAPYAPPYPTSRFYPYFYFAFYEVDGARHAQSLSWRLYKLQDEYSAARSSFRMTRERSIPGVLFNATMLDDTEAKKLAEAKHQEYVGLRPANPDTPLANLFAPKPVANVDMRVYDPTYILNDMERLSGVQEALSSAINGPGNPKTATEAQIQQSGTNARTTSDRDNLEEMLDDLAVYTAEQALQCLTTQEVQRMAGPKAFWPEGMDIEDLFTLVEVKIEAGTTGKPLQQQDQQAWSTLLPLIKQTLMEIQQATGSGNIPLAQALIELVKETMRRLGDETDVERFLPKAAPPGSPGAGALPPPVMPTVSVSLRGELSPEAAAMLVTPAVAKDQASMAPPPAPPQNPGAGPDTGQGSPPNSAPAAPGPAPGPVGP